MDWTELTNDPCDNTVGKQMRKHLESIRHIVNNPDHVAWLIDRLNGKSCLDVGAVEHNLAYTERPSWKHKQIAEHASKAVGVDILEEPVRILNERGYDFRLCDATSDEYLGERFDYVFLGDVIEHVENAVSLIRFSLRHLKDNGEIIVKTPNPYYIDNILSFITNKKLPNFEHLAWYTPTMALEIARRAECSLDSYIVFPRKRPWKYIFPRTDIFTRDYVYVFKHKPGRLTR
jgi:2-polyprenyl-3-methyl-5-hydroxy-6-metoxy-1,4-benzoquinol methylase